MHPSFDPSTFNDEELRNKLSELQTRLYASHAMAMSYGISQQFQEMITMVEDEMQTRFALDMQKLWDNQFPDVIESDPDMKPGAETAKKADPSKKKAVKDQEEPEVQKPRPTFNKVFRKK